MGLSGKPMTKLLKLMALDAEDLLVLSAHVQDGVFLSSQVEFRVSEGLFIVPLNRFAWEQPSKRRLLAKKYQRRRSVLHFSRVRAVRSSQIDRTDESQVKSLLSVTFEPSGQADDPGGTIRLDLGGGGGFQLDVECIEAQLTDLGAAWEARGKPDHEL